MFDKELAEKFLNYISTIPLEELYKRAENVPSSGMGPILDESLLPLHILNNAETLDSETLKLMVSRISNMKPLDPEFNKILNDNFLELF